LKKNKQACLMFSGGLDSTLTAVVLSKSFRKIHLVTYNQGKWLWFMNRSKIHSKELNDIIGPRFKHEIIKNDEIFKKIIKGFCKDYLTYCNNKAPFIYCLSCKLAMHTRSLLYCLENNISTFADGAIESQNDRPEMMPGVLKVLEDFYKEYDIKFTSPIYNFGTRDEERAELRKLGFTLGLQTGDLHKTIQPLCIPGIPYAYWHFSSYPVEDDVVQYAKSKLPLMRQIIKENNNS